jgi:aspartyl-tRNA(Asn)/glutamyl-tRNA(Gln) amidotransferase subunit A
MNPIPYHTLRSKILNGEILLSNLVHTYLRKIEETRSHNIYLEVYQEEIIRQAQQLEKKLANAPHSIGRLFGMVLSLKDVICYKDHQVTAGSKILDGFQSLFSATAVERLLAEDALIIGRVNCDEFAMGSANENPWHGPVINGIGQQRVAGGSSGGSAVSVQLNTCFASLGSDTGGSVRQPASFCGITGFKPSYGRISRHGLIAYGSSFDQIGTLTHYVEDAALLMEIMAGPDEFDSTAIQTAPEPYGQIAPIAEMPKVAYFNSIVNHPRLDPCVKQNFIDFLDKMKSEGISVEAVDFDHIDLLVPTYYVLTTAEASSNLSRYDGVRYGYRTPDAKTLEETITKSRTEGFGKEVKRRIMLGTFVLSAGYFDAYFVKAQKVRGLIKSATENILQQYDFIAMPTTPNPAWKIGEKTSDPIENFLADIFTVQANLAGIPAISIPSGTHEETGLPLGFQLMGQRFKETDLLNFSVFLQQKFL